MKRLCGVNPPVITIFDEHHKVDIEASKRQITNCPLHQ